MVDTLATFTGSFIGLATVAGIFVVGLIALWGIIDKQIRDRRKAALDGADDVIGILKEKVQVLEDKVRDLEEERDEHTGQIRELKATNETLTKILQGRDEATLAFQREVLEAVKTIGEVQGIVCAVEKQIGTMAESIDRLSKAVEAGRKA